MVTWTRVANACWPLWRESVARHLTTADDFFDSRPSPRTESLVAAAVQRAEKTMKRIDNTFLSR
jgi:hypothetical protein